MVGVGGVLELCGMVFVNYLCGLRCVGLLGMCFVYFGTSAVIS